jgi:hypothetical protein
MKLLNPETIGSLPPAIIPRLITLFGSTTPGLLAEIHQHANAGNLPSLGKAAHKLKGSCTSLGAEQMGTICTVLQHKGEAGDPSNISALVMQLETIYPATLAAMKKF